MTNSGTMPPAAIYPPALNNDTTSAFELVSELFRILFRSSSRSLQEIYAKGLESLARKAQAHKAWFMIWPGSREVCGHLYEWGCDSAFLSQTLDSRDLKIYLSRQSQIPHALSVSIMQAHSLVAFIGVTPLTHTTSSCALQPNCLQSVGDLFWAAFERDRDQQTIEAEKRTLETTLLSLADAVVSVSPSGRITLMNEAAGQILEHDPKQALHRPLSELLQPTDSESQARLQEFLAWKSDPSTPVLVLPQFCILTPGRTRKVLALTVTRLQNPEPRLRGCVLMFRDCTEQLRIDAQLALSQKMESIGRLAAGIAHEINTPMQFIGDNRRFLADAFQELVTLLQAYRSAMNPAEGQMPAESARERVLELERSSDISFLIDEVPQALSQMEDGIKRVSTIISAIKSFSHPSKGSRSSADLNRGIEDTVTISRNEWKYAADLVTVLSPSLPTVPCYLDQINQVVLNMIINSTHAIEDSIKAGRYKKGKIIISTGIRDQHAMITIRDDGAGMPAEILPRVFDPFFTTKPVGKGTGQGLAIAHDIIVQRHGGRIEVESEPGNGTTFRLFLPLKIPDPSVPEPNPSGEAT